ncbi:lipase domain-containing protein [Phthorimaea operculella]|nr:lipase domain-containing protein [Phthorimaea operculella]
MRRCSAGVLALCLLGLVTAQTNPRTKRQLTFAENLYVQMSNACRAMADLSGTTVNDQDELSQTMKIVQLSGTMMKSFPINETFGALMQPEAFDITKETKVVIHGFRDSSQSTVPLQLAQAYNQKNMFNVLLVDAEAMLGKSYIVSVRNARLIGKRLANLLANLENFGASAEDFHLLGISLGAHIAGWAGKYFQHYKGRRLGRITGLDPAGPCFSYAYSELRLDKTDAMYVDVIHSNRLVQGVIEPVGHSDFYLNGGGPMQPGCIMPSCSHLRAAEVFTESVNNPKTFVGLKCSSWKNFLANSCENSMAVLGYGSSTDTRGLFYLRTAASPPYGLGMAGTKTEKLSNMDKLLRTLNMTNMP